MYFCYFHFYRSHRRTRVKIEQTFGQLKRRFPCQSLGLRVAPQKACQIIKACCVLYNLSKEFRELEFEGDVIDDHENVPYQGPLRDHMVCYREKS